MTKILRSGRIPAATYCFLLFLGAFAYSTAQPVLVDTSKSAAEMEKVLIALADTMIARGQNLPEEGHAPESVFQHNLMAALRSPKTFSYSFPGLQKQDRIDLTVSNDGLFRIFNWLSPATGTMYDFGAIVQAKSPSGRILTYNIDDRYHGQQAPAPTPGYLQLFKLPAKKRNLYLAIATGQYSGLLPYYKLEAFEIRNDSVLTDIKVFPAEKDASSLLHLGIELRNDGKGTRSIPEPKYDPKKAMLTIPKIENDMLTGKSTRMKFNGRVFIKLN